MHFPYTTPPPLFIVILNGFYWSPETCFFGCVCVGGDAAWVAGRRYMERGGGWLATMKLFLNVGLFASAGSWEERGFSTCLTSNLLLSEHE